MENVEVAPILRTLNFATEGLVICHNCGKETKIDNNKIITIEFCPHCNPYLKRENREILRIPNEHDTWTIIKGDIWFFSLDNGTDICYNMDNIRTYYNTSTKFAMEV